MAGFEASFAIDVEPGQFVTATATDPNGNTSSFSRCTQVTGPSVAALPQNPRRLIEEALASDLINFCRGAVMSDKDLLSARCASGSNPLWSQHSMPTTYDGVPFVGDGVRAARAERSDQSAPLRPRTPDWEVFLLCRALFTGS
jgi:hypothetical protein